MKLTEQNIAASGIKLGIEIPDEIEEAGIFYEPVRVGVQKKGEPYWRENNVLIAICEDHTYLRDYEKDGRLFIILRPIDRPTAEWLEKYGWTVSERPEVVRKGDEIYMKECCGQYAMTVCAYHVGLIGRRRFKLTERVREVKKEWVNIGKNQFCKYYHYTGCKMPADFKCDFKCWQPIPAPAKEVHTSCEICGDQPESLTTRLICDRCFGKESKRKLEGYINHIKSNKNVFAVLMGSADMPKFMKDLFH